MFNLVRKVVAGPKNTLNYQGQQLDLTYITQRVVAMAYPACDIFEKTYRNPIQQVASYLNTTHPNNYLIVNVSSRKYDHSHFNQVLDFQWPDHQAPPISTLVDVAYSIYQYLSESSRHIVCVHCNHGKGRTGSSIIAFMLLVGYFKSAVECLKFYNSKRFSSNSYGVDQPCQLRYLQYLEKLIQNNKIPKNLICFRLKNIKHKGLDNSYFMKISRTRTQQVIYQKIYFFQQIQDKQAIILGDIFIQILQQTWKGVKKVSRINFNTFFLGESTSIQFKGQDIKVEKGNQQNFEIKLQFQYYCLCHLPIYNASKCFCPNIRGIQQCLWNNMIKKLQICKKLTKQENWYLIHGGMKNNEKGSQKMPINIENKSNIQEKEKSIEKKYKNIRQKQLLLKIMETKEKKMFSADQMNSFSNNNQIKQTPSVMQQYQNLPSIKIFKVQNDKKQLNNDIIY